MKNREELLLTVMFSGATGIIPPIGTVMRERVALVHILNPWGVVGKRTMAG
jgi:hypothetical protein